MKDVFHDLKALGTALKAKKIYLGKAYKYIPEIIDKLANLHRFQGKYHKQSYVKVHVDAAGSQIKLLGDKCPVWLKQISDDVLVHCFDEQVGNGDYKVAFTDVNFDKVLVSLFFICILLVF